MKLRIEQSDQESFSDFWSATHPDRKPDSDVGESADLGLLPTDMKKDGAGEEGRTPDLMLGKHTL
jgi:hypothetical protein